MKKSFIYTIAVLVLFSSCVKKILDKEDKSGLDEGVWDNETTANLYLNRCYQVIMPQWPANAGNATLPLPAHSNTTDDYNNVGSTAILNGTLGVDGVTDFSTSATSNTSTWYSIRRVNLLLTQIDKGSLSEEIKRPIKAQAFFLRAYIYFQLVKLYGGVPYLTEPQDWISDDIMVARNKTSECIDLICKDLDSAAAVLPGVTQAVYAANSGNRGRITKSAAMALKARVLLYWASPQFNPGDNAERWERAYQANKVAYDSLKAQGYALHTSFANAITDEGSGNNEVIIIRSYDGNTASGRFNSYENLARASSEGSGGSYQPTWDLVEAFPMKDGFPVGKSATYKYDTAFFWRNRDPRLDATVVINGSVWGLSAQPGRRQWAYVGLDTKVEPTLSKTGFYARKGVNTSTIKSLAAYGTTDWVEMRFAEVMLNLAECANATSRQSEAYDMLKAIRARAGISANSNQLYGLTAGMSRTEMQAAIMLERRIEFAFEGKRYDDLRRTRGWDALNGKTRKALVIVPVEPAYKASVLNAIIPGTTTYVRDTINLNSDSYAKIFKLLVAPLESSTINFRPEYYFYPIPPAHLIKNPNMQQTMGWQGGTFDPLQ
jgi:hypothetical protein